MRHYRELTCRQIAASLPLGQEEALRLAAMGLTKTSIAKKLSLGEATVYRILARERAKKQSKSQN